MKTLFLGSYGYGNLGDELCLIEAMRAFPSSEAWAFSVDPAFTSAHVSGLTGFIRDRADIKAVRPERIVLGGGGVGFLPSIRDMLHWMDDGFRLGAQCHIHNIGVALIPDLSWVESAQVQRVLSGLASCSVRDDISWFCMKLWPAQLSPTITYYPERSLPKDDALVVELPRQRKLLGISITGQELMRRALRNNADRVIGKISQYHGYAVVPVISTVSASDREEDDIGGFKLFREICLRDFELVSEKFLDVNWWRENFTPARLKGIIASLDVLVTQRKHNLIHAIDTKTPVVGIYPSIDDSIARIFYTLRDKIPPNSSELSLTVPS